MLVVLSKTFAREALGEDVLSARPHGLVRQVEQCVQGGAGLLWLPLRLPLPAGTSPHRVFRTEAWCYIATMLVRVTADHGVHWSSVHCWYNTPPKLCFLLGNHRRYAIGGLKKRLLENSCMYVPTSSYSGRGTRYLLPIINISSKRLDRTYLLSCSNLHPSISLSYTIILILQPRPSHSLPSYALYDWR